MLVRIPGLLRSYTGGAAVVASTAADSSAGTLAEVLIDLDRQFPGLRFRIVDEQARVRPHIKLFVDGALSAELTRRMDGASELMIVGALSGG